MKIIMAVAVVIAGGYFAFQLIYPTYSICYRLTLEATVDGRPAVGAGVVEVDYVARPHLLPDMQRVESRVRGQAVMLDFEKRGTLFALLREGQDYRSAPKNIVPFTWWPHGITAPADLARLRDLQGRKELPFDRLPMLVRFRDINDPTSVEEVDPNDLSSRFGPGVKLARVTIETTSDPVTTGIEIELRWLHEVANERGTLMPHPPRLLRDTTPVQLVAPSDFQKGEGKLSK